MKNFALGTAWGGLIHFLFGCGAASLLLIVAATLWDVIARNTAMHAPIWLTTFVEFALPISTMLAAPYLVRQRAHVAMELIDGALGVKSKRALIFLTDLAAAGVSFLVAYYAALGGLDSWSRSEIVVLAIDVPRWILFAVLAIGLFLCSVEFLRHAVVSVQSCMTGSRLSDGGPS